ncbi:TPA: XRE family transcriptional regulator [Serratia marcescens]
MIKQKKQELSLSDTAKETIPDRLRELIAGRSVRGAAKDWGLSFSTLNNYLTRGTEPSLNVALKIAEVEHVSVEWLAGLSDSRQGVQASVSAPALSPGNKIKLQEDAYQSIKIIFESLDSDELARLTRLLGRKGADALTLLLDEEAFQLLNLSGDVRKAALLLEKLPHSRLEEILVECSEVQQDPTLNVQQKQAG